MLIIEINSFLKSRHQNLQRELNLKKIKPNFIIVIVLEYIYSHKAKNLTL